MAKRKLQEGTQRAQPKRQCVKSDSSVKTRKIVQDSRLLSLPAELRNDIWEYVLHAYFHDGSRWPVNIGHRNWEPALLRVCRQIHADAGLMWHSSQSFGITIKNGKASKLISFAKHVQMLPKGSVVEVTVQADSVAKPEDMLEWCHAIWKNEGCDALVIKKKVKEKKAKEEIVPDDSEDDTNDETGHDSWDELEDESEDESDDDSEFDVQSLSDGESDYDYETNKNRLPNGSIIRATQIAEEYRDEKWKTCRAAVLGSIRSPYGVFAGSDKTFHTAIKSSGRA